MKLPAPRAPEATPWSGRGTAGPPPGSAMRLALLAAWIVLAAVLVLTPALRGPWGERLHGVPGWLQDVLGFLAPWSWVGFTG
ncbi:MAG: hypothetical protein AAB368_04400, partial [bacterium]